MLLHLSYTWFTASFDAAKEKEKKGSGLASMTAASGKYWLVRREGAGTVAAKTIYTGRVHWRRVYNRLGTGQAQHEVRDLYLSLGLVLACRQPRQTKGFSRNQRQPL